MVPYLIWQNSRDTWEIEDFCDLFTVLKLKPPSEKEIFDKFVAVVKFSIYTDGYNWSFWKTVGGARYWGDTNHIARRIRRMKRGKTEDEKGKQEEDEKTVKRKGTAPLKGEPKPKGRGRGNIAEPESTEESSESQEEKVVPKTEVEVVISDRPMRRLGKLERKLAAEERNRSKSYKVK